jgi:hypothetical protein
MINDKRKNKEAPWAYVVFTDSFMSGWGWAKGGRSLYALAVANPKEADIVLANGRHRTDMQRGRIVALTKADGTPKVRLGANDHMSIVDRAQAARWYEAGAFAS